MTRQTRKTRKKSSAFPFKPFSEKQNRLRCWYMDGSPYRDRDMVIADGAIRSGKTVAMICGFFTWSLDAFKGENFILAGKTIGALKRNVIGPALKIINGWGLDYHYVSSGDEARIEVGENTYYLYDAHDERSQDRLQGLTAAGALADEVALFPRSFVEQMVARCSVDGSRIWMNCNPENPQHYVKTELIDRAEEKGIYYMRFSMDDNLTLSQKTRERYERYYTGVFYDRFIRGLWVVPEGLVYRDAFSDANIVQEAPASGEWYISVDYGTQNPTAMGLWCVTDSAAVMVREYYYSGRENRAQKTDEEYYQDLEALAGDLPIECVIVDPSAASFKEAIRKHGRFSARNARNDVIDGIRFTASLLKRGKLLFLRCCEHIFREFELYAWDPDRSVDAVLKENDHCMDQMRYFAYTILRGRFESEETEAELLLKWL